jgi:hypothetical protein
MMQPPPVVPPVLVPPVLVPPVVVPPVVEPPVVPVPPPSVVGELEHATIREKERADERISPECCHIDRRFIGYS